MKGIFSVVASLAAGAVFATEAPDVNVISFSTVGPDTYADGTTVLDGECYALVWSADGAFDGIRADGTAVDANDRVVFVAPFAKGGKCEPVVFQLASALTFGDTLASDGVFDVYLLDTRVWNDGVVTVGKGADGKVKAVNRAVPAVAAVTVTPKGANPAPSVTTAGVAATAATALPDGVGAPKISAIDFDGDYVVLTVDGTAPCASYAVEGGTTPAAKGVEGAPQQGAGTIRLVAPKTGNSGFFRINRK